MKTGGEVSVCPHPSGDIGEGAAKLTRGVRVGRGEQRRGEVRAGGGRGGGKPGEPGVPAAEGQACPGGGQGLAPGGCQRGHLVALLRAVWLQGRGRRDVGVPTLGHPDASAVPVPCGVLGTDL